MAYHGFNSHLLLTHLAHGSLGEEGEAREGRMARQRGKEVVVGGGGDDR